MANYPLPVKGVAYIIYIGLPSQADTKLLQVNPTIASGDFKVSIDGGSFANLATLPAVTPSGGRAVKITLSTSEMNGDNIAIQCVDASGAEWCDQIINVQTATRGIDDLAYPATSGRSMVVDSAGLVDANAVKVGPTGSGTAQTARNLGLALPAVAPNAAGGLLITAAGSLDMDDIGADVDAIETRVTTSLPAAPPFVSNNVRAASTPTASSIRGEDAGLSSVDSFYSSANCAMVFTSGALIGLTNKVTGYTGATRTFAFSTPWPTAPAASDTFILIGRLG